MVADPANDKCRTISRLMVTASLANIYIDLSSFEPGGRLRYAMYSSEVLVGMSRARKSAQAV